MSTPENPLKNFNTYQMRHILAVFKYTEDAEKADLTKSSGRSGDTFAGGTILVNELSDDKYAIKSFIWRWKKTGADSGSQTTSLEGLIDIQSRTGGQFIDWYRREITLKETTSSQYMTFVLKTYFMGTDTKDVYRVIQGSPLIFQVPRIENVTNSEESGSVTRLLLTGAYNTTAQNPTLSKPFQITLTHKAGDLNNTDPEIKNASSGIEPRATEDATKFPGRQERMLKSKPMLTLKDLFDAFETELNQQPFAHKRQVQTWLSNVRDNFNFKIEPPEQLRGEELPIQYHVELDPLYEPYTVDNRNLPFEQMVEDKEEDGVTTLTFRPGATIVEMVGHMLRFSRQVGQDAADPLTPYSYKVNLSFTHEKNDKVHVYIKVRRIYIPANSLLYGDTGPGVGAIEPLEFTYKSGKREDLDMTFMKTSIESDAGMIPLETGDRYAVFGNREPITGERIPASAPGDKFFNAGFSGLRAPIVPYLTSGLEDAQAAASFDLIQLISDQQTSDHEVQIMGNPQLMFDLHRSPFEASTIDNAGSAVYYKVPEIYPMYIKIKIYLQADATLGQKVTRDIPQVEYYKNWYEVSGVINDMTDGRFYQHLILKKADDIV